ncbi:KaiA family protein [Cylindrospermopsis curvispora GIHE-G1]|uniref:Circadian clock oscillator protein KaiA n=1 Tax=Cylindrospermopsis curvispora GIHE-G1 TaxID=2666332 RepID=A0A7H0EX98_9CYAN|nr:KaiA family protein [Cylindrospermopsis curvispora GIHE-G1]
MILFILFLYRALEKLLYSLINTLIDPTPVLSISLNTSNIYTSNISGLKIPNTYLLSYIKTKRYLGFDNKEGYTLVLACENSHTHQQFQDMTDGERHEILKKLKLDYGKILLNYFSVDQNLKTTIDQFISTLFCANIPVPQVIEIHMELIDEFSKQLKLEGRSDETLLDYRLTLIDVLANLCEVYRCSISRIN